MTKSALLIREGKLRSIGASSEVILDYRRETHEDERLYLNRVAQKTAVTPSAPQAQIESANSGQQSYGDMDATITRARVLDERLAECGSFRAGELIIVEIVYSIKKPLTRLNIGFRLRNKEGVKVYSGGTFANDVNRWFKEPSARGFWHETFNEGEQIILHASFPCILGPNLYEVQAFICEEKENRPDHQRMIHWKDEAAFFIVSMDRLEHWFGGVCDLKVQSSFSRSLSSSA
jgi:lipopolysaccharide transport system ATP-binding protein